MHKIIQYCIICVIKVNYLRQNVCIIWDAHVSPYFTAPNGVKQGGVMSPILFNMYMNILLLRLKYFGLGFHIRTLAYEHNITLLCPSIRGINTILNICYEIFGNEFDLIFNEKT